MNVEWAREFLGWSLLLNVGLLIWWFLAIWLGHDLVYRYHSKIFRISVEVFDSIHYGGIMMYKVGVFTLNLVPYLVLLIME